LLQGGGLGHVVDGGDGAVEGLAGQAVERHRDRIADLELRQGDFMHGGPHEDGVQPADGEQGRLLGEAHAREQGTGLTQSTLPANGARMASRRGSWRGSRLSP